MSSSSDTTSSAPHAALGSSSGSSLGNVKHATVTPHGASDVRAPTLMKKRTNDSPEVRSIGCDSQLKTMAKIFGPKTQAPMPVPGHVGPSLEQGCGSGNGPGRGVGCGRVYPNSRADWDVILTSPRPRV